MSARQMHFSALAFSVSAFPLPGLIPQPPAVIMNNNTITSRNPTPGANPPPGANYCFGIDLGTSNSSICFINPKGRHPLPYVHVETVRVPRDAAGDSPFETSASASRCGTGTFLTRWSWIARSRTNTKHALRSRSCPLAGATATTPCSHRSSALSSPQPCRPALPIQKAPNERKHPRLHNPPPEPTLRAGEPPAKRTMIAKSC